jgi:hypothetical protein
MNSFLFKVLICLCFGFKIAIAEKPNFSSSPAQSSSILSQPPITVTPHRAEYNIELVDPQKSGIKSVKGKLTIEIADQGEGWTFEQRCLIYVTTESGSVDEFRTTVASWETKDGRHYTFTVTSLCNQQIIECIHGHATADPQNSGVVIYQHPDSPLVRLPANTLFPLQYLNKILNALAAGKTNLPNQKVFDGISEHKDTVDINLTITPMKPDLTVNKKGVIDTDKAWSLQMGIFQADSEDIDPDYEITQTILKSGIILSMIMSMAYGEETFKAKATLTEVKVYS